MSSRDVAAAVARGVSEALPECEVVQVPMADGGEGTLDVLAAALDASIHETVVSDPLGRPINARFGIAGKTSIVEVAQACGLSLLSPGERNPLVASSRGVGEILLAAYSKGCRHFLVGLGGSATCDGGAGMLSVPGIKEVLKEVDIEALTDVSNPFIGPQGAARVFAPQKGASPEDVEILEDRMRALAGRMKAETGKDISWVPGAGAAGGLGGALLAYGNATLVSGVDRVMELCRFDDMVKEASLVITGEGRSDSQTLMGKVPMGVLRHTMQQSSAKMVLLSGSVDPAAEVALKDAGFSHILASTPAGTPLEEALNMESASANLRAAARLLTRFCTVKPIIKA